MKISYKGDYALKVILDLAIHYPDKLVHTKEISQRQDIPKNYLEQILLTLRQGGFIQSKKGPQGGYSLTRKPMEIGLGEVIRHIEGPIYPISCVDKEVPPTCDFINKCAFFDVWTQVGDAISRIIDSINFEQLREQQLLLEQPASIMYHI